MKQHQHQPQPQHPKGESHRIYWQQWFANTAGHARQGRRELITSSAAIRISPDTARARDVTQLLRTTLNLTSLEDPRPSKKDETKNEKEDDDYFHDALVLVGTLYSLPRDYVQFEHEPPPPPPPSLSVLAPKQQQQQQQPHNQGSATNNGTGSATTTVATTATTSSTATTTTTATTTATTSSKKAPPAYYSSDHAAEPFHVVKTLAPNDNPLQVRDALLEHLKRIQEHAMATSATTMNSAAGSSSTTTTTTTPNSLIRSSSSGSSISPKIQWYFVPGMADPSSPIPTCIDLDGYCTSMEDEEEEEEENDEDHDADEEDVNDMFEDNYNESHIAPGAEGGDEHDICDTRLFLDSTCSDYDLLVSRCPLLSLSNHHKDLTTIQTTATETELSSNSPNATSMITSSLSLAERKQRRRQRCELRRYTQLSQCHRPSNQQCVSGYLLKQSHRDPHVWRRVHCVLTEDYLWHVTRVEQHPPVQPQQHSHHHHVASASVSASPTPHFRMARHHGRIDLVRALLLEPNTTEYSPLYRTPYSFEVVSVKGTSHVFRAPNKTLQMRWIQALSERILQRQENSLMGHAELIVADECIARNKRMTAIAVQPLWMANDTLLKQQSQRTVSPNHHHNNDPPSATEGLNTMNVLRFGMEVAEYRERCRHVQAILPAKQPIVVLSDSPLTRSGNSNSSMLSNSSPNHHHHHHHHHNLEPHTGSGSKDYPKGEREPLDSETKAMVRATWHAAATLLSRATQVAMDVQQEMTSSSSSSAGTMTLSKEGKRMSRSLETLCRHVDYIITGQFRQLAESGAGFRSVSSTTTEQHSTTGSSSNSHDDVPPPMDLFDLLLAELQSVSATSDSRHRSSITTTLNGVPMTGGPLSRGESSSKEDLQSTV